MEIITPHITITDTKKVLHFTLFQMDDTHKVTLFARKCLRGSTAGSPILLLYSTFPRNLLREVKETEKVGETVNCRILINFGTSNTSFAFVCLYATFCVSSQRFCLRYTEDFVAQSLNTNRKMYIHRYNYGATYVG